MMVTSLRKYVPKAPATLPAAAIKNELSAVSRPMTFFRVPFSAASRIWATSPRRVPCELADFLRVPAKTDGARARRTLTRVRVRVAFTRPPRARSPESAPTAIRMPGNCDNSSRSAEDGTNPALSRRNDGRRADGSRRDSPPGIAEGGVPVPRSGRRCAAEAGAGADQDARHPASLDGRLHQRVQGVGGA